MAWQPTPDLRKLADVILRDHVMSFNDRWDKAKERAQGQATRRNVSHLALLGAATPDLFEEVAGDLADDLAQGLVSAKELNDGGGAWARELVFDTLKKLGKSREAALTEEGQRSHLPGSFANVTRAATRAANRAVSRIDRAVAQSALLRATPQKEGTFMAKSGASDPRRVAVVHGRNHDARDGMFDFLRALGLDPIAWEDATHDLGKGTAHAREILDGLFSTTQAVVVLLTGDEQAFLSPNLRREPSDDLVRNQARPNVWIEAGMALGVNPDRTILLRFGDHDQPSDIHGLDYIPFDGSEEARERLKLRLTTVGCSVVVRTPDWLRAGDVSFSRAAALVSHPVSAASPAVSPAAALITTDPPCPNCSTGNKNVYMSRLPPVMASTFHATHKCTKCNYMTTVKK
jgi:predicted nucleotide-binding protein